MEFTKEEIKAAEKVWNRYANLENVQETVSGFRSYLHSLLKPERKKMYLELEYSVIKGLKEFPEIVKEILSKDCFHDERNVKVTELPEGTWTDDEVKAFVKYFYNDSDDTFEKFKSERKSK